ncbi:MAG: sigma-54-dependent Fis family transcriptional regulator [Nitrospinae bacterium]|nr:sigma-54-dependent Fis family transcriptional regulator [Nitrospinota bacterium]
MNENTSLIPKVIPEENCILIVDDEENNRLALKSRLSRKGFKTITACSGKEALESVAKDKPDLVLLDVNMPEMDGFEVCGKIKGGVGEGFLPVILVTARGDKESLIKGFDIGADDYIVKPFDGDELLARVRAMLRIKKLQQALFVCDREVVRLSSELKGKYHYDNIIGDSHAMEEVFEIMDGASKITSSVLIAGESGTGKELVARGIHYSGLLADKPFIPVNCASLPGELIESELFGHKKGAFTGAIVETKGLFQAANHGTLFLDEITEMPIGVQAKLLRVLQEGVIRPVGGTEEIPVDVRVISASNRDPEKAVKDGKLREDLYYRLNVIFIKVPPLRDRKEDIPVMAQKFMEEFNAKFKRHVKGMSEETLSSFLAYEWPGNVRELRNVIESCYIYGDIDMILPKHFRLPKNKLEKKIETSFQQTDAFLTGIPALKDAERGAEKQLIEKALRDAKNNKVKAAKILGIHRSLLYKKMEAYNIK